MPATNDWIDEIYRQAKAKLPPMQNKTKIIKKLAKEKGYKVKVIKAVGFDLIEIKGLPKCQ